MFQTHICKDAAVLPAGTPEEAQLQKINALSKSPLEAQEVYCFSVRLCDDQPDRDFERFNTEALPRLAELFIGKTGICNHEWSSDRQVARIFDTEVLHEDGATFIRAHAYMLRTEKNADLIAEIEGGIKKEVSVGCAMGEISCSVCGEHYGSCSHQKGTSYGGSLCLAVLSKPKDAYEFSFVAVPAQRDSGVLKAMKGGLDMSLEEFVSKSGSPALLARLHAMEEEAAMGRQFRRELETRVVSLGLLLDFGASENVLRTAVQALKQDQLLELKEAMEQKAAALFPPKAQLAPAGTQATLDAAFII